MDAGGIGEIDWEAILVSVSCSDRPDVVFSFDGEAQDLLSARLCSGQVNRPGTAGDASSLRGWGHGKTKQVLP